ncbi:MAG: L,D-transpeptidase [Chloroflexota bacterium]
MRVTLQWAMGAGLPAVVAALVVLLAMPPDAAEASAPWQGSVIGGRANVRSAPNATAPIVNVIPQGEQVTVATWVTGQEVDPTNDTWAQLGEGRYVYSAVIQKDRPAGPPPLPDGVQYQGRWIDVNVTEQLLTAYEGAKPVHMMVISSGRPEYPTPMGSFTILKRVYNETMTSASVPWVRDSYNLKDVLFTQYFTGQGAALHLAYWKTPESFGIPTSHGCVGMPYKEAEWLWNWARVGTPVYVHE